MPFKWLHPGLKLKRWVILLVFSIGVLAFALSGMMGRSLTGLRVDVIHPATVERWAKQVQSLKFIDIVLLLCAGWGVYFALRRIVYTVVSVAAPAEGRALDERVLRAARRNRGPRVVAIGGGTGLPNLLAGLKAYSANLTAIVTVADDGGSSGRLRRDLHMLPPGDLRNCLVALAETEPLMARLFQHRFGRRGSLSGHSFGNLFIAALTEVTGDFGEAVRQSSRVLAVSGRVLPVTLDHVTLLAQMADGRRVRGESRITASAGSIRRLSLDPESPAPNPEVLEAVSHADAVVLGPGSLFTSILPNLLVPGVAKAIQRSSALKIYVCNIMTQPGETDGFSVSRHLEVLRAHTGASLVDYVVANSERPPEAVLRRYAKEGQQPVALDREAVEAGGVRLLRARLLEERDGLLRHHPGRLSKAVMRLIML